MAKSAEDDPNLALELCRAVFACVDRGTLLFLDLSRDEYHGVPAPLSFPIAQMLGLGNVESHENGYRAGGHDLEEQIRSLKAAGLVCAAGKHRFFPAPPAPPRFELTGYDPVNLPSPNASAVTAFLRAAATASVLIRTRRLESIVARVARRNSSPRLAPDRMRLQLLVEHFSIMTPIVMSGHDQCLRSSLILIEFLALHSITAKWTFGVRSIPFRAHCWVELNGCILNDSLSQVGEYSPLMQI